MKQARRFNRSTVFAAVVSLCVGGFVAANIATAEEPASQPSGDVGKKSAPVEIPKPGFAKTGAVAFGDVAKVLQSPRCMNCHPAGNAPLQTDASVPHAMNVTRTSSESGLKCSACHMEKNSEAFGIENGPPGAPNWHLPPKETPMVFEGLSPAQLCKQLKDPAQNGGKTLAQLLHHVREDALVLWGWEPGGNRTKPPLAHDEFVAVFETWVDSGGACPQPSK